MKVLIWKECKKVGELIFRNKEIRKFTKLIIREEKRNMANKVIKKIITFSLIGSLIMISASSSKAVDVLGSKTKNYSNGKGHITVLSDVSTDQYDSRYFIKGSIYYNTSGNLSVCAWGYYYRPNGTEYVVVTNQESCVGTAEASKKNAEAGSRPLCDSGHRQHAEGSSRGGAISVNRY